MKVEINEIPDLDKTSVEIRCRAVDEDILSLERHIRLFSKTFTVKSGGGFTQVPASQVYYFEALERKTFVYTKDAVFETDFRLYELEEKLGGSDFFRASKSVILNLRKVHSLTPELNRMMLAILKNGEKVYISRQYAQVLKETLQHEKREGK